MIQRHYLRVRAEPAARRVQRGQVLTEQATGRAQRAQFGHQQVDGRADRPPARGRLVPAGLGSGRSGQQDPPDVVWPPPGATEIPELPENPEPPVAAEPEEPDEPVDVPAEEPVLRDAAALPVEPPEPVVLA